MLAAVSAGAATLVTVAFLRWDRGYLTRRLFPWRLLVLVTGLFLVVDTIGRHGLSEWMAWLIGSSPGAEGVLRAAATGGLLSNVLNNLPAYVAGEAVVALAHHDQLLGLLIGTNIGPLITPWASLATLLWAQHCRSAGLDIRWGRFVAAGAVTSTVALTAATAALLIPS